MQFSLSMRSTALLLATAVLGNAIGYAAQKPVDVTQVKAKIVARGVGQGVRVVLVDKSEQKGLIVSIGDQSFSLKPKGTAPAMDISYSQITGVHRDKLSTGQKVGITVAIVAAVVAVVAIVLVVEWKTHPIKT
jgi:hypothetical protein